MPAKRELTLEEYREREARRREQSRLGMARLRATRRAASLSIEGRLSKPVSETVSATPEPVNAIPPPSHTLPSPGLSTTDRLLERLAPFASRAFKPDPAFLALLAERYPGVDLELELAAALDWLEEPRHAKRRCSKGFLANWVKKADADRKAREALPPPVTRRELVLQGQPYLQPQSQQPNHRPDYVPAFTHELARIDPAVAQRELAERKRLTLPEKLAAVAARNGRHP